MVQSKCACCFASFIKVLLSGYYHSVLFNCKVSNFLLFFVCRCDVEETEMYGFDEISERRPEVLFYFSLLAEKHNIRSLSYFL